MKKIIIFASLALMLLLSSCAKGPADSEIIDALADLSEDAYELNLIIYGDGLLHEENEENGYYKVSEDAKYTTAGEIKKAMSKVFSPQYIEVINNTAFRGVSVDEGTVGAKFMESESGELYVNPSVTENFGEPRKIDTSKAKIKAKNAYAAVVVIPHEDGDIEVTMRNVEGKWFIDSPIF